MDINTDLNCSLTKDSDMVLVSSQGQDVTMATVSSVGHSDWVVTKGCVVLEYPQASGVSPDPRHLHSHQWQQEAQTSTQTLAVAGLRAQILGSDYSFLY